MLIFILFPNEMVAPIGGAAYIFKHTPVIFVATYLGKNPIDSQEISTKKKSFFDAQLIIFSEISHQS